MIGKTHMIWLALAAVSSGALFHTSYRVQELQETLGGINRQIIREQEAIQVLKAEWSYLNEPGRLERLAREYTMLVPTEAVQLAASVEAVPMRDPALEEPALIAAATPLPGRKPGHPPIAAGETRVAEALRALDGTQDPIVTGGPELVAELPPEAVPSGHAQMAAVPTYGRVILTSYGNDR